MPSDILQTKVPAAISMTYDRETVKAWAGDSQWRALRADYARYRSEGLRPLVSEGFWAIAIYRFQRMVYQSKHPILLLPVRLLLAVVWRVQTTFTRVYISSKSDIGPGLCLTHGWLVNIDPDTKIGADCTILHVCTIGAGSNGTGATIGDSVKIYCHSSIIGKVTIGDNAIVAANTLVITDVPARATAIGVPAKIIPGGVKPSMGPGAANAPIKSS
jgi:serine O-acetyltransferase